MTEEFAFEEGLGDCGAVDGDEWPLLARTDLMDRASDDFFSGAALPADEHGGVALGDAGDELLYLADLLAFAYEVAGLV